MRTAISEQTATAQLLPFLDYRKEMIPAQLAIDDVVVPNTALPPLRVAFTTFGLPMRRLIETTNADRVQHEYAITFTIREPVRTNPQYLATVTSNYAFYHRLEGDKLVHRVLSEARRVAIGSSFSGDRLDSLLARARDRDLSGMGPQLLDAVDAAIARLNSSKARSVDDWARNLAKDLAEFDD